METLPARDCWVSIDLERGKKKVGVL